MAPGTRASAAGSWTRALRAGASTGEHFRRPSRTPLPGSCGSSPGTPTWSSSSRAAGTGPGGSCSPARRHRASCAGTCAGSCACAPRTGASSSSVTTIPASCARFCPPAHRQRSPRSSAPSPPWSPRPRMPARHTSSGPRKRASTRVSSSFHPHRRSQRRGQSRGAGHEALDHPDRAARCPPCRPRAPGRRPRGGLRPAPIPRDLRSARRTRDPGIDRDRTGKARQPSVRFRRDVLRLPRPDVLARFRLRPESTVRVGTKNVDRLRPGATDASTSPRRGSPGASGPPEERGRADMSGVVTVVEDCPLKWTLSAQVKVDAAQQDSAGSGVGKIRISMAERGDGIGTTIVRHALLAKSGESPVECLLTGHEPRSYSLSAEAENGQWGTEAPLKVSLALGKAQTVSLALELRAGNARQPGAHGVIDSLNADEVLEPGDVLIKFAGESSTFTEKVIEAGEKAVKKLSGLFHEGIKKGDPTCFHVALYLGQGRTAEAHGGDLSTARVGTRTIDEHAGFLFRIYRCQDRGLAEAAVRVAETWANGRMKYLVPALVPFHLASFGPKARGEALIFGQESGRAGGPLGTKKMFCSQFVIAVYQAAAVAKQLRQAPRMISTDVQMPEGLDLHASNASPLALHARLEGASAAWRYVDEVLVRPQHDANAGRAILVQPGKDVTDVVQVLGNPTEKRWPSGEWIYARNPWSLRAFEGKIYVGSGNSNNPPPAANAGPVDLWALDARSGTFPAKAEKEIPDEQVDVFRILSDGLWIPGHDSKVTARDDGRVKGESKFDYFKRLLTTMVNFPADWDAGNAHHKVGSEWKTWRSFTNGIHVYDLLDFDGALFAAIATVMGGQVARSSDRGKSWDEFLTKR